MGDSLKQPNRQIIKMVEAKAPKAKKVAKPAAHPPYANMIVAAIKALKDKKGSSRQAILKYVVANNKVEADKAAVRVKLALRKMVAAKKAKKPKAAKKPAAKKAAKPKKAAKKPAAKKAAKKPAAKKPAAKKPAKKAAPKKK